jgi:adenylate cyclase
MADLKGFTGTAEKMEPDLLMDWVNEYMGAMARLVEEHGGTVDDYAGDGIKANFGAPVPRSSEEEISRDACNAIECAIAMSEAMQELNRRWEKERRPTARMRIGIQTGTAVVGSLGSDERLKFTSVGDTVNTASRLESFEKEAFASQETIDPCRILIGEDTFRLVTGRFAIEALGEHSLPGKAEKISIYRVCTEAGR